MQLLKKLNKPEYFFQPIMIFKKIFRFTYQKKYLISKLSWGDYIYIKPNENIGKSIYNTRIYDLSVTETIFRLCKPGDHVIDVGANIGYTCLLILHRLQNNGSLTAFEPHPEIFQELRKNIELNNYNNYTINNCGLSDSNGIGQLVIPAYFSNNEGVSFIEDSDSQRIQGKKIKVNLKRLDDIICVSKKIKLLKLDVEGHELKVLQGATELLKNKVIENILFESNHSNNLLMEYLKSFGYNIYRLDKKIFKLYLNATESENNNLKWEPTNFLATLNNQNIYKLFSKFGYSSLK